MQADSISSAINDWSVAVSGYPKDQTARWRTQIQNALTRAAQSRSTVIVFTIQTEDAMKFIRSTLGDYCTIRRKADDQNIVTVTLQHYDHQEGAIVRAVIN